MKTDSRFISLKPEDLKGDEPIGGKAKNLAILSQMGLNVPTWIVIPQEILLSQLPDNANEYNIKDLLEKTSISCDLANEILDYFGAESRNKRFAVRSSASDEDGKDFSFAGQFDTFLGVAFKDIPKKVKELWKSVASSHVIAYRKKNDLPMNWGISVIIQEMVEPTVSGVAFGADPVSGDLDKCVISSVYGLGEGLVSGLLDADTYTIDKKEITSQLAKKTSKLIGGESAKTIEVTVPEEMQDVSSLTDKQIYELQAKLNQLYNHYGHPQDVEFCYRSNELFLLQTRPVTTLPKGEYILWDNSNIIESYPGITTPLTFSFILKMYEFVYRQFVQLLGVKPNEVERHKGVFANTLGLVRGRVYYNLLSWYKMLAMVPGYALNAEYMENMMGVKERFELSENYQMSKGMARWRIVTMAFKMFSLHKKLPKERKEFQAYLNKVMTEYQSMDFNQFSPKEIIEKYKHFEQALLLEWKAPLINDFFAMIWFGMLQKQTEKLLPNRPNIHNDLLCGSQDIISVEPIHRTIAISQLIRSNPDSKALFETQEATQIWSILQEGKFPEIKNKINAYLADFGDRCIGELKLETVAYGQEPEKFVKIVKAYVTNNIEAKQSDASLETKIREEAEQAVSEKLKGNPLKKWWFNFVRNKARDLVSNRENLRYERTRGFGMVRKMFVALGKKWHQMDLLKDPKDIFYLELEEIKAMDSGNFNRELIAKIEERKTEFANYKEQIPPQERFSSYGNDFSDQSIYSKEKLEPITGDLKGIGCCPGRVKAKVQVILDPQSIESLEGDILVTSSTDPGWVTLFPTASAIVVERGSLLSHSAIVAREMSIPCIVGVTGLLRTLKTGDEIEIDGSSGEIKIL